MFHLSLKGTWNNNEVNHYVVHSFKEKAPSKTDEDLRERNKILRAS